MQIWIDVLDASGNKYGDGPITTATGWTSTRRLDRAGEFSFTMPASDPRLLCADGTALLQHKRVVRCWAADENGIREKGAGIIDTIEWQVAPDGGTTLLVAGSDLLRELANRTVGDLELFEAVEYTPTLEYQPGGTVITVPGWMNLNTDNFVFIRHARPFSKINFNLTTFNASESKTLQIQYYNAQDPDKPTWEAVAGVTNTTNVGTGEHIIPFGQDGYIEFDPPSGWSFDDGSYTIRIFDSEVEIDQFYVASCTVTIVEPVDDGLQRIMALAPDGWSLDPAGMYATWDMTLDVAKSVYMQFAGESVLAALVLLAEQTGEHFTLSAAARRVWWIGEAQESSGLRAVQSTDSTLQVFAPDATSQAIMLITDLSKASDSYELYTRAYAYGAGVGSGRLTMEKTTRSTSGYTLGALGAYLECDAAIAIYGRIDKREDYPDIAPVDTSAAQIVNAANTLYDRVLAALRRKSRLQYAYNLEVIPSKYEVWPGQTIRVDYHEWVDNFHAVNIATDLWVLEAAQTIGDNGAQTVALTVATVDYWSMNDYRAVAALMGSVQADRSVELPATGFTSIAAGNPVTLDVQNGQVVSVGRVVPVDDGLYPSDDVTHMLRWIRIKSGIVTEVGITEIGP